MPELPEIRLRADEIDRELSGRTIVGAHLPQPKCLNLAPELFQRTITGLTIHDARPRGKWVVIDLGSHYLLLSLGMGGDVLLHAPDDAPPTKLQALFELADGGRLSVHFWWFGYLHLVARDALGTHQMTARLGPDALAPEFTPQVLAAHLTGRRAVKSVLLDQSQIAGIGNMYSHDILYRAGLHPLRPANTLTPGEVEALWRAMRSVLQEAIDLGGAFWEVDLHGRPGRYDLGCMQVAYKEGQPCPRCGAAVVKLKTGATTGFICPTCQPLQPAATASCPSR